MNISRLMSGVIRGVKSSRLQTPQPKSTTIKEAPIKQTSPSFFSQEAQDERVLKRMRMFERKNKERARKEQHDKKILCKWGFNK